MKNCPFCNEEIQDKAIKCRYCLEFLNKPKIENFEPILETKPTGQAIADGVVGGGCVGCFLIIFGIIFCAFGITAFIGIPLIIFGVMSIVGGPMLGITKQTTLTDRCPFCASQVTVAVPNPNFKCPICKKLVVIKDNKFLRID